MPTELCAGCSQYFPIEEMTRFTIIRVHGIQVKLYCKNCFNVRAFGDFWRMTEAETTKVKDELKYDLIRNVHFWLYDQTASFIVGEVMFHKNHWFYVEYYFDREGNLRRYDLVTWDENLDIFGNEELFNGNIPNVVELPIRLPNKHAER
jgi:hypothetical protein